MLTFTSYAQDESRWGGGVGYATSLFSHTVGGVENEHTMIKLGVTREIRLYENASVFYSMEYSRISAAIPTYSTSLLGGDLVPAHDESASMITLMAGGKREKYDGLFYVSGAIILEYDFGAPEEYGYALQNGLGVMMGIGKDIHFNELYVLSIDPGVRLRSGINFRSGETGPTGDSNHSLMLDLAVTATFSYKFF